MPLPRLLPALCALLITMTAPATAQGDVFPFKVFEKKLANGLTVIAIPTGYPDIVALQIPVRVGSRNEVEEGRSGFAHFFEHMMFRGTDRFSADEYNEVLKRAGADSNAYTSDDFTNYHTTFSKPDLETVLELEADRFKGLKYPLPGFETEARAVLGEYNKNYADPVNKLLEAQRDRAFTTHTYKHTTMGFIRDIERMPTMFDYSRTFFDRFYRPERTTIIVSGDVTADDVFRLVEKHWADWKPGTHKDAIPPEPEPTGAIHHHVPWSSPTQPWVAVAFRGPAASTSKPDLAAMEVIGGLAFGSSSDLYKRLVVDERKVDQLFAYFPNRRDPHLLTVMARVKTKSDVWEVRDQIQETFNALTAEPLEAARLAAMKSNLRYRFAGGLDDSEAIAAALVPFIALHGDWRSINQTYGLYDQLDPAAVQEIAQRWFKDERMIVTTLAHGELPPQDDLTGSVQGGGASGGGAWIATPIEHYLQPSPSPLVDIQIVFHTGAADDDNRPGLANLTAAMVTRGGSEALTYADAQKKLFPMAASFSAQVDKEMTVFSGRVHQDHLGAYWKIVSDQLLTPGWRDEDFDRIRNNVISSIRTDLRANNDEELGKEILYERIYEGDTYGSLTLGHVATLESLKVADLKEFWGTHYRADNVWVGIAGGFSQAFTDAAIRTLASELPKPRHKPVRTGRSTFPIDGHQVTIVEKDTRATALSFGMKIDVTRAHDDFAALWLARSWLGEHRSSNSHLFQRMREIRGMNYGDYAYIEYFPRGMFQFHPDAHLCRKRQIFQVWVRPVPPEQGVYALRIARYELDKLIKNGLTEEQFNSTREFLTKYLAVLEKSQDRQLGYAMDSRWYDMPDFVPTMRARLGALTRDAVNAAIKKHLSYDALHIVFITKDASSLRAGLTSDAPSPISYSSEKPRSVLEEDKLIERYPLGIDPRNIRIIPVKEIFEK